MRDITSKSIPNKIPNQYSFKIGSLREMSILLNPVCLAGVDRLDMITFGQDMIYIIALVSNDLYA